jgi:hypothetical protein
MHTTLTDIDHSNITAYENPFTIPYYMPFHGINLRFHNSIMGISQQFNRIYVY